MLKYVRYDSFARLSCFALHVAHEAIRLSPPLYYKWIKAPLQIDQGLSDEEVPYWWSENLAETLKKNGLSVELNTFPNADHNMLPNGWNDAVAKTLHFYQSYFAK